MMRARQTRRVQRRPGVIEVCLAARVEQRKLPGAERCEEPFQLLCAALWLAKGVGAARRQHPRRRMRCTAAVVRDCSTAAVSARGGRGIASEMLGGAPTCGVPPKYRLNAAAASKV